MKKINLALLLVIMPLSTFAFTCPNKEQNQTNYKINTGSLTVCSDEKEIDGKLEVFFESTKVFLTSSVEKEPKLEKIKGYLEYPNYEFTQDRNSQVVFIKEFKNVFDKKVVFFASEIKCEEDKCFQTPPQCTFVQKISPDQKKKLRALLNKIKSLKPQEHIQEKEMLELASYALMGEKKALQYFAPGAPTLNRDGITGEEHSETVKLIKKLKEFKCFKEN